MNLDAEIAVWIGIGSSGLTSLLVVVYILISSYQHRLRSRNDALVEYGVAVVANQVGGCIATDRERQWLKSLPERIQLRVFHRLEQVLGGDSRHVLVCLGMELGLTPVIASRLVKRSPSARLQAVRYLRIVSEFDDRYHDLLRDPDPWVRMEAVEWAGNEPRRTNAQAMVRILASDDYFCRSAAQDSLIRIGQVGSPEIEAAMHSTSDPEQLEAILFVTRFLHDPMLLAVTTGLLGSQSPGVRAGAALALGAIGRSASRDVLIDLLNDTEAVVRSAAASALADFSDHSAAAAIIPLLDDEEWSVRSAGARALKTYGDVGRVLLQDYVNRGGEGIDIAKQALDESKLDLKLEAA